MNRIFRRLAFAVLLGAALPLAVPKLALAQSTAQGTPQAPPPAPLTGNNVTIPHQPWGHTYRTQTVTLTPRHAKAGIASLVFTNAAYDVQTCGHAPSRPECWDGAFVSDYRHPGSVDLVITVPRYFGPSPMYSVDLKMGITSEWENYGPCKI